MCNRLVIIGAGGHGKVVADIAIKNEYKEIVFLDDGFVGNCMSFPIILGENQMHGDISGWFDVNRVTFDYFFVRHSNWRCMA